MKALKPLLASAAAVALLAATPASATGGAPPETVPAGSNLSGVTVTPAPKANALVDPTSQFVREHLPENAFTEQYPRFRDAVCVKVQGLPEEFNAFVAKRIVEVAAQVKAPVAAPADCTPNVNVIFTPSPKAQLDDIAKRRDVLMGYHLPSQVKKLTTFNRPIEAWYVTRTRDDHGESFLEFDNPIPWNRPGGQKPVGRAGSRLGNGLSAEVVHSLILADANKVSDEKIGAVADYIAVLALARWQGLDHCNSMPTILNLMADGCDRESAPQAATAQDLALLTGLYSVEARELGSQQRATIASAIRKAGAAQDKAR
jgi:hypothetical protein